MAFTRRNLTLLAGLLLSAVSQLFGAPDAPPPATFRLYSLGSVEPMYYRLDAKAERRVSLSTAVYSRSHPLPADGTLNFYRIGTSDDPKVPPPKIPVTTIKTGAAEPGRTTLIILVPGGTPGLPAPVLADGTRAEFAAQVLDDSPAAHPVDSVRVVSFSTHNVALKLSGDSVLQIPPLANKIIPYPTGDRGMLQIAAFTDNMWAPVASTMQMLVPGTRITIFMTDTPPTADNPNPTSIEYRKVAEVIRRTR
ncbi:MAG: hypothetical protein ABII82_17645 [Verrucomicrobiota bacterium]